MFSATVKYQHLGFNSNLTCFQHRLIHPGIICEDHTSPNILYKVYSGFHPGIMGRSNNSHKIFPRIFLDRTVDYKQGGVSPRKILLRHPHICSRKGMVKPPPRSPKDIEGAYLGGIPWGLCAPNKLILQPLDCCYADFGKLRCHSYAITLA